MTPKRFRTLALGLLAWTLLVILWGTYVRATGSGAGCGDHWPLCDGEVIPRAPSVAKLIEFTHRLTSGLAGILSLAVAVAAFRAYPSGHRVRRGAVAQLALMFTESAIGAGLVLFEYVAHDTSLARAWWVAAHLVNTFALVAAITVTVWWSYGGAPLRLRNQGSVGVALGSALGAAMLLGVSGAIAALGATLFPAETLAEGLAADLSPTAHLFVRLRLFHVPIAVLAAALTVAVGGWVALQRPSPGVRRLASTLGALFLVQLGIGTANLVFHAPVALQVVHLLMADAVWITLVLLSAAALAEPVPSTEAAVLDIVA